MSVLKSFSLMRQELLRFLMLIAQSEPNYPLISYSFQDFKKSFSTFLKSYKSSSKDDTYITNSIIELANLCEMYSTSKPIEFLQIQNDLILVHDIFLSI